MPEILLEVAPESDAELKRCMKAHYSKPKGFVARRIVYAVVVDGVCYGFTVAGSATRHLKGRAKFLGRDPLECLNQIVNNTFFHIEKRHKRYPTRNFATAVVMAWEAHAAPAWEAKYGDAVIAVETLVELPRTGECYRRAGWTEVGQTKGCTCKRVAGKGSDSWTGKRVWDTKNLRPKLVFMKSADDLE